MEETDMVLRGFVTIATGDEKYYKLAFNLLRSYKLHCTGEKLPFAVICDRKINIRKVLMMQLFWKKPQCHLWINCYYINMHLMMKQFLLMQIHCLSDLLKVYGMILKMQMTYPAMEHRFHWILQKDGLHMKDAENTRSR